MLDTWHTTLIVLLVIGLILGLLPAWFQFGITSVLLFFWTKFFYEIELSCGTGLFSIVFFLFASCYVTSVMWLETFIHL